MRAKSMAKELKGTVKEILGTAFSVGCTVAGKSPKDVQAAIDAGKPEYIYALLRRPRKHFSPDLKNACTHAHERIDTHVHVVAQL